MKHSAQICDQTAVLWSCDTIVLFSNVVLQLQTVKSNVKRFFSEPSMYQSSITCLKNRDSNKSIQVSKELTLTNPCPQQTELYSNYLANKLSRIL